MLFLVIKIMQTIIMMVHYTIRILKKFVITQNGKNATSFTIPNSVTSIGEYCFDFADSLKNVIIPKSVKTIEKNAFNSCNSLTELDIPESVTINANEPIYF